MHRLALAGLLPVVLVAPAPAQNSTIVTEDEFLAALDASHPAVAASVEALEVARARVVAARTFENPVLAAVREDPTGPVQQTDWTLSWQMPGAGRRPEIEAREQGVGAAEARLAQQLLSLRLTMREVYSEWAHASVRRELLAAQAGRVTSLADREALRAERGEASGLETHRLALAATALELRAAQARAAAGEARARARRWHPDLPAGAQPVLPALPPAPEPEGEHPLVRAAEADLAAATLERDAAGRFVRSPELSVGWQRQEAGPESVEGPILGLAWSVPALDRNGAEKAAAEARLSGARARLELVRRKVESARRAARATFERLSAALADAETALAENERMLDGAEAAFRAGEASLTDLLETQRSVTESELAALELHAAALEVHRELVRLAGAGDPARAPLDSNPNPNPKELLP